MCRLIEIFKPIIIDGIISDYIVSDGGRVMNYKTNKFMTLTPTYFGYYRVMLTINGKHVSKRVHRLVVEAFIPNPDNKPTVNHIDGDKTNNNYENLEWATYQENTKHAFETGLNKGPRGEASANSIYTTEQIIKVCELLQENNLTIRQISKETDVKPLTIRHICAKKRWRHVSKNYDFSRYNKKYYKD